jgi:hypothetical protein
MWQHQAAATFNTNKPRKSCSATVNDGCIKRTFQNIIKKLLLENNLLKIFFGGWVLNLLPPSGSIGVKLRFLTWLRAFDWSTFLPSAPFIGSISRHPEVVVWRGGGLPHFGTFLWTATSRNSSLFQACIKQLSILRFFSYTIEDKKRF